MLYGSLAIICVAFFFAKYWTYKLPIAQLKFQSCQYNFRSSGFSNLPRNRKIAVGTLLLDGFSSFTVDVAESFQPGCNN